MFYSFLLLWINTTAVLYGVECVSGYNTCSDLLSYLNHTRKVCEKYVISLNTNHGCNLMFCHFFIWCLKNISPSLLKVFHNFRSTKDYFSRDIYFFLLLLMIYRAAQNLAFSTKFQVNLASAIRQWDTRIRNICFFI